MLFYTDEYFNKLDFTEISFEIGRNKSFIEKFPNYKKIIY